MYISERLGRVFMRWFFCCSVFTETIALPRKYCSYCSDMISFSILTSFSTDTISLSTISCSSILLSLISFNLLAWNFFLLFYSARNSDKSSNIRISFTSNCSPLSSTMFSIKFLILN